jgi:uncharacterized protein with ParB-like and HNH nuclease domain
LSNITPKIITIQELLEKINNLEIPDYQRPYKWQEKHVKQLIDDILFHKQHHSEGYRLGTIILHNNNNKLDIVDGQQRILTLCLLAKVLSESSLELKIPENDISIKNLQANYSFIQKYKKELKDSKYFFLNKCQLVEITINDDISEAFAFFDSQNTRGKPLKVHDLLKAFHLREMKYLPESTTAKIVENWETIKDEELSDLFANYLFRIKNWSKEKSALYFTKNEIDIFKGINLKTQDYPFMKHYHSSFPFQIDTPIINGEHFFKMVEHYYKLAKLEDIQNNKIIEILNEYPARNRTGDKYVRNLFNCALLYYIDKFGEIELEKAIKKIFALMYIPRLQSKVYIKSVNNHAIGTKFFSIMRNSVNHNDVLNFPIYIPKLKDIKGTRIDEIKKLYKELGYEINE